MSTGISASNGLTWSDLVIEFESAEDYHARDGVSVSRLKDLRRSPELFARKYPQLCGVDDVPLVGAKSDAMSLGTVTHEEVLEPADVMELDPRKAIGDDTLMETVERGWVVIPAEKLAKVKGEVSPDGQRRGKAWDEFAAANRGRLLLKEKDVDKMRRMVEAIKSNRVARELIWSDRDRPESLFTVRAELSAICSVSYMTPEGDLLSTSFRSRFDYLRPLTVVDLKTTRDGDLEKWPYQARDLGYDMQAAAYRQMAYLIDGQLRDVVFVVVENVEPHRCDTWTAKPRTLDEGRMKLEAALIDYMVRRHKGDWNRDYLGQMLEF